MISSFINNIILNLKLFELIVFSIEYNLYANGKFECYHHDFFFVVEESRFLNILSVYFQNITHLIYHHYLEMVYQYIFTTDIYRKSFLLYLFYSLVSLICVHQKCIDNNNKKIINKEKLSLIFNEKW